MPDASVEMKVSIREMMRTGLGYEDIAVALQCPVDAVRREAHLLRGEGRLTDLYRGSA